MRVAWEEGDGGPGVSRGLIAFASPALAPYRWPLIEIAGLAPGPRLCVMAGVHVNESSSMAAAASLAAHVDPRPLKGRISIIPLVNVPAEYRRVKEIPVDGRNLHELYPGDPRGTFSQVLAHALLFEWAADAAALLDLHGGDFGQALVKPFVVVQTMGERAFDARARALARCFDPPFVVALEPSFAERPGRAPSALARVGRLGLVVEAGAGGALDPRYVAFHRRGVVNVARHLGMLAGKVPAPRRKAVVLDRYLFVNAPADGFVFPRVKAGDRVRKGEVLAEMRDALQRPIAEVAAPATGYVTWQTTQILAKAESRIVAMGRVARSQPSLYGMGATGPLRRSRRPPFPGVAGSAIS